jgi:hypothetical protein
LAAGRDTWLGGFWPGRSSVRQSFWRRYDFTDHCSRPVVRWRLRLLGPYAMGSG